MYNKIIVNGLNIIVGFNPNIPLRKRIKINKYYNVLCKIFVNKIFDNPELKDSKISYTSIDELSSDNIEDICILLNHNLETTNPDINIIELGKFDYFMNFEVESLDKILKILANLNRKTILICHGLNIPNQILTSGYHIVELTYRGCVFR